MEVSRDSVLSENQNKIALTYDECAQALGISAAHLKRLVAKSRFPCIRLGRSVRFLPEDVRAWLTKKRRVYVS